MRGYSNWGFYTQTKFIKTKATKRETGNIYRNKIGVARRRECEHSRKETDTRWLGCWGSSARWRIHEKESQRLRVTRREWHRWLLKVRDGSVQLRCTGASGQSRAQLKKKSKGCSAIFWRNQNPSYCEISCLCRTQNSLQSQATWWSGPVELGTEWWV